MTQPPKERHYNTPRLTLETLEETFLDGCKKDTDLQVGVEWEKVGIYQESGKAIAYFGERGVLAIFQALSRQFGWEPVESGGHVIALKKKAGSITLEPGGQIELSGWKARNLDENAAELRRHLKELKMVSEPLGITWLGLGAQPFSTDKDIEWVPKARYQIMRENLKRKGRLTTSMMKETASVQISVDYTDESDAMEKLRLAFGLAPVLSGLFANSPVRRGHLGRYRSRRLHIWHHTDPSRTGIPAQFLREGGAFKDYVELALGVPMLFIIRGNEWIAVRNRTFKQFMEKGFEGWQATEADWELHLTTIFTEARLKKYIEIRCLDCQKTELGLAAVALLKGIFYDKSARKAAWHLVAHLSAKERQKLSEEAALLGIQAHAGDRRVLDLALELVHLAEKGLGKEAPYLDPIKELLALKKSPADLLIQCLSRRRAPKDRLKGILCCAAI
ncbi:MAG: hypothetical protein HY592_02810 [Candidatus Omnitrophica bacterium]|nr:hypothetical protein [Candidatus Omnitrophota bacterium]